MTENAGTDCKGCFEVDAEAEVERLWKRMVLREGEAVPEEVYRSRIAACEACEALQGGSTCRHCGCLVRWRARLTASACPYPGSAKW
ncbi:MAG: hypothetical protein K0R57_1084 [Paenibacillaceae bacterium]|jgi:hypothetical protein|nr:hypothetical protein [Paenibacillaceae bacterium]